MRQPSKKNDKQSIVDRGKKKEYTKSVGKCTGFPTTQWGQALLRWLHNRKPKGLKTIPRLWNSSGKVYYHSKGKGFFIRTLYSTTHTKILRGMRKKFIMVLLASSGMYWDLIFIMDGQNIPTQASKAQNPINWMQPEKEMLPPFTWDGATKNCSESKKVERTINWKLNRYFKV